VVLRVEQQASNLTLYKFKCYKFYSSETWQMLGMTEAIAKGNENGILNRNVERTENVTSWKNDRNG
jgi:hypothetical protein